MSSGPVSWKEKILKAEIVRRKLNKINARQVSDCEDVQTGQELSDSFAVQYWLAGSLWSGFLNKVADGRLSEMLDLQSEEKLTQYSIFVFEGFGWSLSEFKKQVTSFEAWN